MLGSGRQVEVDEIAIVVATVMPPPERLGVTHWSAWLLGDHSGTRSPRSPHFTPTSASWLNILFGIITRQAIRRGTFTSVPDLIGAIATYSYGWNERAHPFTWTKTADEILTKANRKMTSNTRH